MTKMMNQTDLAELKVDLPNFTGPLDLLLHLIRSQKVDIYDIPIAKITKQYLAYLKEWQEANLQIAGEYFLMASTLLRIKSQSLLPQNDFDSEYVEEADPREDLVNQLVQYEVFQGIAGYLKKRNQEVPFTMAKEPSSNPQKEIEPLKEGQITSNQLAAAFALVLKRFKFRQPNAGQIKVKETSIAEMASFLKKQLATKKSVSFFACVSQLKTLDEVVSLFLAILDFCGQHFLTIEQEARFGDLKLSRRG